MLFTITFSLKINCVRCGQTLREKDWSQGNCELTWPTGTFQHKTCPVVKTHSTSAGHFAYLPDHFPPK